MELQANTEPVREQATQEPQSQSSTEVKNTTVSMSTPHEAALITIVSMAQFATQAGVGQTLAILHIIGNDLKISESSRLSWLMAAYSLTVGTFILPSGRFGDVFGYKQMYIVGLLWFAIWTLVAGLSVYSGSILLIFARALQGIGPAICLPNSLAILGGLYPPGRRKNIVFSIFGAMAPLGSVAGATFASLFAKAWWPWTYYSFAIVLMITAILTALFIPAPQLKVAQARTRLGTATRLDPLGSIVGVLPLVLVSFAWNQAPVVGWNEPYVYLALIIGLILAPVFFYIEATISSFPLVPFACVSGDIGMILACVGCGWSCFGIFLYYIWQFFELLRHGSPLLTSAWYSTNAVSGAIAALLTGLLLNRIGPAKAMILAMLSFVIGTIFIATSPVNQTYWAQSFLCLLIIPFGMDISFPAATVIVSDQIPPEHQGIGASLVNTVVNWSISMGLGFAGTVEVHVNHGGDTQEDLLLGYRGSWYTGIGLSSLGLIISVMFWLRELRRYQ